MTAAERRMRLARANHPSTPRAPLRIALIGPHRYPVCEPFPGGLEAHVSELADGLRRQGHEVSLFARAGSTGVLPGDELEADWAPSAAALQDVSMPEPQRMLEHHAYLRLMLRLIHGEARRRFDVIHLHAVHHLPVAMAPALTVPVLATLHTPPTPWLESALAVTGGLGATFTAVSHDVAKAWTVLPETPIVVHNGVDTDIWRPGPGGGPLVWSGRLVPEKAPHLAVQAARAAGRRLVIAGPASDRDYVAREVTPLLGDDVTYAGHLGRRQLADLVGRASAVLVTPRWEEPFGLIVAEALACGTPVVAFDRGGIREVVGASGSGLLVPADDVAAMAAAVPLTDRIDRAAVRRDAVSRLSIDRMVETYVGHYRRLIGDDHPAVSTRIVAGESQPFEVGEPALHGEPAPPPVKLVGVSDD